MTRVDEKNAIKRNTLRRWQIRATERQVIARDPDPFLRELQYLTPGWTASEPKQLKRQLDRLQGRHMFVAETMSPRRIADVLEMEPSEIFHWVDTYGWQEMRQRRELRRSKRFALNKEVNAYMIEQQADQIMSKAGMVANDILDQHFNGDIALDPSGLKSIVESAKTIFEIRGAIRGSDKVGEKLKIELSGEVQHSLAQMLSHTVKPPTPITLAHNDKRLAIKVEDAGFAKVDRSK